MKNIDNGIFIAQGVNQFKERRIRELDIYYRQNSFSMNDFRKFLDLLKKSMEDDMSYLIIAYESHGLSEYEAICIVHDLYYSWINKDSKSEQQKNLILNAVFPKKEEQIETEPIKVKEPIFRANPSKSSFLNSLWDTLESILPK